MKANVFFYDNYEASNASGEEFHLCVDKKVHIKCFKTSYDQTGDEAGAYDSVRFGDLEPCDGSCQTGQMDLPEEAIALVKKFLASDGKDCGEFTKKTPKYPEFAQADSGNESERAWEAQEMGGHLPKG